MPSKKNKATTLNIIEDLDTLLKKRNGGAINFRGIQYQILYSCHLILKNLYDTTKDESITLEGLEDLDHNQITLTISSSEFIQLKSSDNKLNAGDFWTMNVLQNFLQVYLADNSSKFRLVHNFKVADGALRHLFEKKLTINSLQHWQSKLNDYCNTPFDIQDFFDKITYERISFDEITSNIKQLLFRHWNINIGTERQFTNALVNSILQWSKERQKITHINIYKLFGDIKESYSKAVINEAVKNNWIEFVNYAESTSSDLVTYYDGKAAKPHHISSGLPAQRKFWEKKIIEAIMVNDAVVIRSSSGQGKSTLAWRVGYLLKDKYNIYQLHSLKTWEQANSTMDFLQSRVALGEFPIVIIDGLDSEVDHWQMLVQRTSLLPVRYIITSRHEDWIRYGADISTISLKPIDINIGKDEAEDIYNQFKQKGKLHNEIKDWQPIWEQVLEKGLLIEYTYLLTRGEMIRERLSAQIQKLKDDKSPAAKTEILRIVSTADCLQLKISTKNLIHYIDTSVTFSNQDRGEVLRELQNEYFLNFNEKNIEGLHPIRSSHLLELLHGTLPISDTLINLYQLLEERDRQNFFRNVPLLLGKEECKEFYYGISKVLGQGSYIDMVYALNGVSYAEPQKYWLQNQKQFDEVFKTGGLDLFIIHTIPGKKINTLDELLNIIPSEFAGNISRQNELLKTLSDYNFEDSDVTILATALLEEINTSNSNKSSYKGLGHLAKWYKKLDLKLILPFDDKFLSEGLKNLSIIEAKGLFQYMHLSNPRAYDRFIQDNKQHVINYLRKTTNSISITEYGSHINIQYIYDAETGLPSNEESVTRIESVFTLLPFYEKYNTEAIMLAFPTEEIISVMKSDADKSMSPEYIPDSSEVSYSSIWIDTIGKNYDENSAFQWQKKIMEIRNNAIEWCKSTLRIIDSTIEGNLNKRTIELQKFVLLREKLGRSVMPMKPYPRYDNTMPHTEDRKKFEKSINNWFDSVKNSDSQIINLFSPKGDNDQNLASINLKAIFLKLKEMQTAFHDMEKLTTAHFDSLTLDKNEDIIYYRLYKSVIYYMEHLPMIEQVPVKIGRITIEKWYDQFQSNEMSKIKQILKNATLEIGYDFVLPKRILKSETYASVVIGIKDFDFSQENAILLIAQGLHPFADYPAVFFTVISIKDNIAIAGLRFKRDFFELIRDFDDSKADELNRNLPLPVIPDEQAADLLNIGIKEQDLKSPSTVKYKILVEVWKLSKTKSILSKNEIFEREWLGELEEKYLESIEKGLNLIPSSTVNINFINWVREDCNSKKIWLDQDMISKIVEVLQEEANDSYYIL
jgi:hypothetical protein